MILDCTIRDGGYYNNWDFENDTITKYIDVVKSLPIDYVEIGYFNYNLNKDFKGKYYYCNPNIVNYFKSKTDKLIAVMIDEKNIDYDEIEEKIKRFDNNLDLLRIAVSSENLARLIPNLNKFTNFSFKVAVNLMNISDWIFNKDFLQSLNDLNKSRIDFFYLVDSKGNIRPMDLIEIIKKVRNHFKLSLGFHGHNNLELALSNTISSIDYGIEIVDSTFLGMGRGAGNLRTELLLAYLFQNNQFNYDKINSLLNSISKQFKFIPWGSSFSYTLTAIHNLPQSYVSSFIGKKYYSLNSIKTQNKPNKLLNVETNKHLKINENKVLIIGGGTSILNRVADINHYIKMFKPLLIFTSSKYLDIINVSLSRSLFCFDGNEIERFKEKNNTTKPFKNHYILINEDNFVNGVSIPKEYANKLIIIKRNSNNLKFNTNIGLVIDFIFDKKNKIIEFIGFDGYEKPNEIERELFYENEKYFDFLNKNDFNFYSLFETKYSNLNVKSIYFLMNEKE